VGTSAKRFARVRAVRTSQRYRLRNPASGREIVIEADRSEIGQQEIYLDRETGEPLEIVGELLPLAPSASRLPWAVENMRFCSWCYQLAQKDLNDCPTCSRRMGPLASRTSS
jgi:RNA polymerase subunit RPABC4/transcription elongation factor Spt4